MHKNPVNNTCQNEGNPLTFVGKLESDGFKKIWN